MDNRVRSHSIFFRTFKCVKGAILTCTCGSASFNCWRQLCFGSSLVSGRTGAARLVVPILALAQAQSRSSGRSIAAAARRWRQMCAAASRASVPSGRLQRCSLQAPHCKLALTRCDSVSMASLGRTSGRFLSPRRARHSELGAKSCCMRLSVDTLGFFETGKNSRLRGPRAAPGDA